MQQWRESNKDNRPSDREYADDCATDKVIAARNEKFIAVLGGSGIPSNSEYYKKAEKFARSITKAGFAVMTGGGTGIMEAGNKGANASSRSYGLLVRKISDAGNKYINDKNRFVFNVYSMRTASLLANAHAIVVFPGGTGTLDELNNIMTQIWCKLARKVPIYLIGSKYWGGYVAWLRNDALKEKAVCKEQLALFTIEDDVDKVVEEIAKGTPER